MKDKSSTTLSMSSDRENYVRELRKHIQVRTFDIILINPKKIKNETEDRVAQHFVNYLLLDIYWMPLDR